MKNKIIYLITAGLIGTSACTKKVESNDIVKFTYNTPTYTVVATSNQPIFYNTYFSDADNAISLYASGNNGSGATISKKTRGTGFQIISVITQADGAAFLTMANASTGYFAGGQYLWNIYGTSDSGKTWSKVNNTTWNVGGLAAPDAHTLFMTSAAAILKSTDGGATFNTVLPQNYQHPPYKAYFYNANFGFVLQDKGRIAKTTDGGQTWAVYTLPTTGDVGDIFFTDTNRGYAVAGGDANLFGTTDGGATWTRLVRNDLINSGKLFFYPDGRGIIAVLGSYILYTRDYGKTVSLFLNITGNNVRTNINAVNDTTLMLSTDTKIYKVNFSKN